MNMSKNNNNNNNNIMMENLHFMEIPKDEQDNSVIKSFTMQDITQNQNEIKQFFDQFGFVIFNNVINQQQCQNIINDIWSLQEETNQSLNRNDPDTWNKGFTSFGLPSNGPTQSVFRQSLLHLRQSPTIHQCFAFILQSQDIICGHDRWIVQRPTVNVMGTGKDHPEWQTVSNVHLDMNPVEYSDETAKSHVMNDVLGQLRYSSRKGRSFISENNIVHKSMGINVQGILNLADLSFDIEGGGTIVVPGSHKVVEEWAVQNCHRLSSQKGNTQFRFDSKTKEGKYLMNLSQRVPMKAGSLLIWDQRLIHGSTTNYSSEIRYGIPIRFFSSSLLTNESNKERCKDRKAELFKQIRLEGFERKLTNHGRRVFGLDL